MWQDPSSYKIWPDSMASAENVRGFPQQATVADIWVLEKLHWCCLSTLLPGRKGGSALRVLGAPKEDTLTHDCVLQARL